MDQQKWSKILWWNICWEMLIFKLFQWEMNILAHFSKDQTIPFDKVETFHFNVVLLTLML